MRALLIITFFCLFRYTAESRSTLHVIALMATDDIYLKYSAKKTLKKLEKFAFNLAKECNFNLNFIDLSGELFELNNALFALENENISENDVIFYYVMGHGWRYRDHSSSFQNVFISYKNQSESNLNEERLVMESLYPQIEKKSAKLNVIIFDACSNVLPYKEPERVNYFLMGKSIAEKGSLNIQLFTGLEGYIRISAASIYQGALSDQHNGSFYSHRFFHSVERALKSDKRITWEELLNDISLSVNKDAKQSGFEEGQEPYAQKSLSDIVSSETDTDNDLVVTNGISQKTKNFYSYVIEGTVKYKGEFYGEALNLFSKAQAIYPEDEWVKYCINICEASLGYTKFRDMDYKVVFQDMNQFSKKSIFLDKNFAASQYVLGILYLKGLGCKKNRKEARRWLEKSCRNGHVGAKIILSLYGIFEC